MNDTLDFYVEMASISGYPFTLKETHFDDVRRLTLTTKKAPSHEAEMALYHAFDSVVAVPCELLLRSGELLVFTGYVKSINSVLPQMEPILYNTAEEFRLPEWTLIFEIISSGPVMSMSKDSPPAQLTTGE